MEKKWIIYLYISEDDQNGISSFFMDLALLTKNIRENIKVLILYRSYNHFGSYFIKLSRSLYGKDMFTFHRLGDDVEFSNINILYNFIKLGIGKAERYALFFGMHGYTWYIKPSPDKFITVDKIKKIILNNNIVFDIIGFDCCYMATIETAYELYCCTKYIIGCENASPNLGFNTEEMINAFSNEESTEKICIKVAESFIRRNNNAPKFLEYPTDVSIINLNLIDELVSKLSTIELEDEYINSEQIKKAKIVNDDGYQTYDLYYIIYKSDIDNNIKNDILKNINKVIIKYMQSELFKKEEISNYCYGLAFTPFPYKINENSYSYRNLKLKEQFCDKSEVIPGC